MRCLTLAVKLASSGWTSVFAVGPEAMDVAPGLANSGFEIVPAPESSRDWSAGPAGGARLLVVDHYGLDGEFESSCRDWARMILAVDDLADRPHDCDLLLDTAPGREPEDYRGLVPEDCRMLLGPEYVLVRDEFAALRPAVLARREREPGVRRIMVSFGLTDPAGATALAVQGILASGINAEVDVILGRKAPAFETVAALAAGQGAIRLHEYVPDMPGLMAKADLALGAPGTTSWERCCLGLPAILMILADNQELNARELAKAGAALNLGRAGDATAKDVAKAVSALCGDPAAYLEMSGAAARICDGLGALRAALAVHPPARAKDGGPVGLRLAGPGDMALMFEWQSDPETRRYARNPEPPSLAEHRAWFERALADPERELFVIEHHGRAAGIFRLDRLADGAREVSIVVAPGLRGRGLGGAALEFANGFWPGRKLHAEVLPGNEASRQMFLKAGYTPAGGTAYKREALK